MQELSLNILDISQNSISAGASLVTVTIREDTKEDILTIKIEDNGCGMSEEFLSNVTDPFTTTRTTRKVGLGIPLFKMAAESTGGAFKIESTKNVGTVVFASFGYSNIDRMPLGDIASTMATLFATSEATDFVYNHSFNDSCFSVDTRELKNILGDVSIGTPDIQLWIIDYINENLKNIYGG